MHLLRYNIQYLYPLSTAYYCHALFVCEEEKQINRGAVQHHFLADNKLNAIPFLSIHNYISKIICPDVILIHGMKYGMLAPILKRVLPASTCILVQQNGYSEAPKFPKSILLSMSYPKVDGFLFTGASNAQTWSPSFFPRNKVHELMEGATDFKPLETPAEDASYLWVGRLNSNKDPMTILKAFAQFVNKDSNVRLTMVYSTNELLEEIHIFLKKMPLLATKVLLLGKVAHDSMEKLYQEHRFFVLGSHYEGSGYALMEAMACGCIPIITKIPSFQYMTNNGEQGFLFSPGAEKELVEQLEKSAQIDTSVMRQEILQHYSDFLSFEAIAQQLDTIIVRIWGKDYDK